MLNDKISEKELELKKLTYKHWKMSDSIKDISVHQKQQKYKETKLVYIVKEIDQKITKI